MVEGQRVALRFLAKGPEEALRLRRRIEELGGTVSGTVGNILVGDLPVSQLLTVANSPDLDYLAPQSEPQMTRQNHGRSTHSQCRAAAFRRADWEGDQNRDSRLWI